MRRGRRVTRLCAIDEGDGPLVLPVSVDEVRNRAGQLCDRVAAGETVTIHYCGRTVAMSVSCPTDGRRTRSGSHSPIRTVVLS
jgi:antitoxin (DNA-binding transcriptional repressor) of toxin-antitoxin stability system